MTKKLKHICKHFKHEIISGSDEIKITGISFDSRKTQKGHLFIAVKGEKTDGNLFISDAVQSGACAILSENDVPVPNGLTFIKTSDTHKALALTASEFYNHPSKKLSLVGVTGTNGKTTIAGLLHQLFINVGYKAGLISTVKNCIVDKELPAEYTTPDAVSFNKLLSEMLDAGCKYCFTEVSSHAIHQKRIYGLKFKGAVFTNLTHDHLDYHKTFKEYLSVKKQFFDDLTKDAFALTNIDDKNGKVMIQNTKAETYTYALKSFSDFKTKIFERHLDGMLLEINENELWTLLPGTFNAYNMTAIYAVATLLGIDSATALTELSRLIPVAGRMETIKSEKLTAIVDYAHTPDALINVLNTIGDIKTSGQKIITVVGAGGNRDKTKRPLMAKAALNGSDKLILTSDNPRFENPQIIIDEMYAGIEETKKMNVLKIVDRKEAIKTAVMLAEKDDIILIAGKGHENYQEVNGIKSHFDDKETIQEILKNII
jgi:UDP-N-acetylmuramoyl-L-alanyl-D-glutamate--2,6-diaminopimelate ligase